MERESKVAAASIARLNLADPYMEAVRRRGSDAAGDAVVDVLERLDRDPGYAVRLADPMSARISLLTYARWREIDAFWRAQRAGVLGSACDYADLAPKHIDIDGSLFQEAFRKAFAENFAAAAGRHTHMGHKSAMWWLDLADVSSSDIVAILASAEEAALLGLRPLAVTAGTLNQWRCRTTRIRDAAMALTCGEFFEIDFDTGKPSSPRSSR